jgi:hypothetical protein
MKIDNSTGKDKEFYDLGKKIFDRINPITPQPSKTKDSMKADIDLLWRVNSADIEALEDARIALTTIKELETGTYDELIDQALASIDRALGMSHGDAFERVTKAAIRARKETT